MFGICIHKWLPSKDRVQTCSKCGAERVVECPHVWRKSEVYDITYKGLSKGSAWVMVCTLCGEVKTIRVGFSE